MSDQSVITTTPEFEVSDDISYIIDYDYFQKIKNEVYCRLCKNLLRNPKMCSNCDTLFCEECITKWSKNYECCPNNCAKSEYEITKISRVLKKFLDKLTLRCPNGCEVPFTSYYNHHLNCDKVLNEIPINCWNCKKKSKCSIMKKPSEDHIIQLKQENKIKKGKTEEDCIDTLNLRKKIENYYDLIKILDKKSFFDLKIKKLNEQLVAKENLRDLIKKMTEELNKGDSIQNLEKQISDTQVELFNYLQDFEEFILRKKIEHEELNTSLTFDNVNKEIELLFYNFCSSKINIFNKLYIPDQILKGHSNSVNVIIKFKESQIFSGSSDGSVKLWDLFNSVCIKTFVGHSNSVYSLAKINQYQIMSGSADKTIKIWDTQYPECIKTFIGHTGYVNSVIMLVGNLIASGSSDKSIKIWEINSGECEKTLISHTNAVTCILKFNETHLVSASADNTIKIWNFEMAVNIYTLSEHTGIVKCLLKFDDTTLISGSIDKTIKIWNLFNYECLSTLTGHESSVNSLALFGDNQIISGSSDKTVKVFDLKNIKESRCIKTVSGQHSQLITTVLNLDDKKIISSSYDFLIKVYST